MAHKKDDKNIVFGVRMPKSLQDKLKLKAKEDERSLAQYIRLVLKKAIEKDELETQKEN